MLDECSKTAYDTSSNQLCLHESKESARNHAASMSNHTPVARSSSTSTSAPHPPPPPGLGKILNYHLRQTNLYASQHRNTFLKLVNWHAANLEYGMCAELDQVSLEYWVKCSSSGPWG